MWKSIVAVCFGASVGALLRWWLSAQLNDTFPPIPLGTLAANLGGGYGVGLAIAAFAAQPTFSAEIVGHLAEGRAFWACGAAAIHLAGSVLMTFAGIGTVAWLKA